MDGAFSQPKGDKWYWNSTEDYSFGVQVWLDAHLKQTFPDPVWDSKDSAKVNQDKKKWKIPYSHFTEKLEPEINVSGPACLVFPDRTPWLPSLPETHCSRNSAKLLWGLSCGFHCEKNTTSPWVPSEHRFIEKSGFSSRQCMGTIFQGKAHA